jgi:predicted O-methyltransferase YrrM
MSMSSSQEKFLIEAYRTVLKRDPNPDAPEYAHWLDRLETGLPHDEFLVLLRNSQEGRRKDVTDLYVPPGHYYSPIINKQEAVNYLKTRVSYEAKSISDVNLHIPRMIDLLSKWKAAGPISVEPEKSDRARYDTSSSTQYPFGDAWVAKALLRWARPARIVEIGSGFSTANMLDGLDEFGLTRTSMTCIEPDPVRLQALLRPTDSDRVTLHAMPVQEADLDIFARLQKNDIAFIDSTHVMKTGSDVHFEFFHILPVLKPGVLIHFHDCMFPFEYPRHWIDKAYSWNEIYVLRAFLMNNDRYEILFWPSALRFLAPQALEAIDERLLSQCGSGIWLRKRR